MTKAEREGILTQVKEWFRTVIVPNHLKNTQKLVVAAEEMSAAWPTISPVLCARPVLLNVRKIDCAASIAFGANPDISFVT